MRVRSVAGLSAIVLQLALVGCAIDNKLHGTPDDKGTFDSGDSTNPFVDSDGNPATDEECNGVDDDGDGEVDEGYPDADGNGRVDCLDGSCPALDAGAASAVAITEECEGTSGGGGAEVPDPWNVTIKWQVRSPSAYASNTNSYVQPIIGNLNDDNGDGLVTEDDTPEVIVNTHGSQGVVLVLDGSTGAEEWAYAGTAIGAGIITADVDNDGSPDVLTYNTSGKPICLSATGRLKWTASRSPTESGYAQISVADLDEDGVPEVIADDLVLDGPSGGVLFSLNVPASSPYRMAAIADVDNDGDQEMFIAGKGYNSDGTLLWSSGQTGSYGFWPVVVQADSDDDAEIGWVGSRWSLYEPDGTKIFERSYGSTAQPGPPCVGDFDGDGQAEVAWGAYQTFVMYELDGTPVWSVPMNDTSGLAGCSGYDVNNDGALEILFADQTTFKILDGATGSTLYSNPNHRSGTLFEYPTVADTDHDGHAEILITSNYWSGSWGVVTAFENNGAGWPAAGSTWAVHDFAITNINPDGTVPATPEPYWTKYNVYRARVAADDPATPDLVATITDVCVSDCVYGPVALSVQVGNVGASDVDAGYTLSVYAKESTGNRLVAQSTLPAVAAGTQLDGIEFELTPADVGDQGFIATVDDDGTGVGSLSECDETNNTDKYLDAACP